MKYFSHIYRNAEGFTSALRDLATMSANISRLIVKNRSQPLSTDPKSARITALTNLLEAQSLNPGKEERSLTITTAKDTDEVSYVTETISFGWEKLPSQGRSDSWLFWVESVDTASDDWSVNATKLGWHEKPSQI
jgi:hypothetical protein